MYLESFLENNWKWIFGVFVMVAGFLFTWTIKLTSWKTKVDVVLESIGKIEKDVKEILDKMTDGTGMSAQSPKELNDRGRRVWKKLQASGMDIEELVRRWSGTVQGTLKPSGSLLFNPAKNTCYDIERDIFAFVTKNNMQSKLKFDEQEIFKAVAYSEGSSTNLIYEVLAIKIRDLLFKELGIKPDPRFEDKNFDSD